MMRAARHSGTKLAELARGNPWRWLRRRSVALVLAGLCLTLALPASAGMLYRYINDKGYQEIGYTIPPHLVPKGYDIIDESGRLIERVPPQLSDEEFRQQEARNHRIAQCEDARQRVQRRYERLEDIDDAERQFEEQSEESLQNAVANLEYSESELSKLQEQAAVRERAGRTIDRKLHDAIAESEQNVDSHQMRIKQIEAQKLTKADEFNEERRIFQLHDCESESAIAKGDSEIGLAKAE
ncbi:MAG: hypothetical protein AAGE43_19040 [Pseudomonadota bacterium]